MTGQLLGCARRWIAGALLPVSLIVSPVAAQNTALQQVNPAFLPSADEIQAWHKFKDEGGPTYAGSPAWHRYVSFVEERLKGYGVVDMTRNEWTYDQWTTSDWPDDSNWKLAVGGTPVKVAHYGGYSGTTGPGGLTAPLVYYDWAAPPASIEGKIAVFSVAPHPEPPLSDDYKAWFTVNDHEYLSDPGTFPPRFTRVPVTASVTYDVWWQLRQTIRVNQAVQKGKAAGALIVFDMPYDRVAGLYTFPMPRLYQAPTLYLDRDAGRAVLGAARGGANATLTLIAKVAPVKTHQTIAYLPGRDYGTPADEQIVLRTHSDGPSISQDNGPLGVLALVAYYSRIPKAERARTLLIFLDNRHYLPGGEAAFESQGWFAKNPQARNSIVGLIALEHLGQLEYREDGAKLVPTGRVEPSFLWTRGDPALIAAAIEAVKTHQWPRAMVQTVDRPGIQGGMQGFWYGMGRIASAKEWNLPAFSTMGSQGAYWSSTARLDKFDKNHFRTQVAGMAQLTAVLMTRPRQ